MDQIPASAEDLFAVPAAFTLLAPWAEEVYCILKTPFRVDCTTRAYHRGSGKQWSIQFHAETDEWGVQTEAGRDSRAYEKRREFRIDSWSVKGALSSSTASYRNLPAKQFPGVDQWLMSGLAERAIRQVIASDPALTRQTVRYQLWVKRSRALSSVEALRKEADEAETCAAVLADLFEEVTGLKEVPEERLFEIRDVTYKY